MRNCVTAVGCALVKREGRLTTANADGDAVGSRPSLAYSRLLAAVTSDQFRGGPAVRDVNHALWASRSFSKPAPQRRSRQSVAATITADERRSTLPPDRSNAAKRMRSIPSA